MIGLTGLKVALWPKGDILLARAAEKAGIPFVLSTASNASIEEVAQGQPLVPALYRRNYFRSYSCYHLVAKGWLNGIILKWFRVPAEHYDMINLTGIVLYKVGNILFFLVPYIALRIVK
jgi:hypothetical protein